MKRKIDLLVISDTHFGAIGSKSECLLKYLKSISPKTIILNGDIIDVWQFNKRYWDINHTKIVRELLKFISKGSQVHYLVGNHDEALRRFLNFKFNGFKISNKYFFLLTGIFLLPNDKKFFFILFTLINFRMSIIICYQNLIKIFFSA